MGSNVYPLSRKDNIVIQELNDEVLIYDLIKNKAVCLNQTSASVWEECDGIKSVTNIAEALSKKFKTRVSEDYVWLALDKLKSNDLLADNRQIVINFNELSRREVIKKVGMASLIALPVVTSLIAPAPVAAQSCFVCSFGPDSGSAGCPCQNNNECCGNCNLGTMTCSGPLSTCLLPGAPCCPPNIPAQGPC